MSKSNVTTTTTTEASLVPEFISNLYHAANSASRVVRKSCEAMERGVDATEEILSLMGQQQTARLRAELTKHSASSEASAIPVN